MGTELLLGQITDTNSAYLAGRLAALGIDCHWKTTVGDNLGRCRQAFEQALGRSDLVVSTGGLGPTEDDLTREAIAAALGETPAVDPGLERELRDWFARRGLTMPERNAKQAWLIPGAVALPNPHGTAPGWWVQRGERIVVAMPGVPREMTPMWEDHAERRLLGGAPLRSRTLKLLGIGESAVEEALGELVRSTAPTLATYAKADGVHVRITDRDSDAAARDARLAAMESAVRERLGGHIWGTDGDTLGGMIGAALAARGWRVATADALVTDLARLLGEDGATRRYAGGAVLPGADLPELWSAAERFGAEVRLVVGRATADGATVEVRTPAGQRALPIKATSLTEARRRSALGAIDLLRRVLA